MIAKVVKKTKLQGHSEIKDNLEYWLSKTPEERVAAVESLRRSFHGSAEGLQRAARIIKRK